MLCKEMNLDELAVFIGGKEKIFAKKLQSPQTTILIVGIFFVIFLFFILQKTLPASL